VPLLVSPDNCTLTPSKVDSVKSGAVSPLAGVCAFAFLQPMAKRRRLRDNQAGRCTLAVVRRCQPTGYPVWSSAIAGQWRHEDTIAECHAAENDGIVKACHAEALSVRRSFQTAKAVSNARRSTTKGITGGLIPRGSTLAGT
jgi:hypothetical protein